MKHLFISSILLLSLLSCQTKQNNETSPSSSGAVDVEAEKSAIEKQLFSYRDALNTSDVSKVLTLYTPDGVFMPTGAPTAAGQEQVKAAYEFVFKTIQLNIEFFIDEIEVHGDFAFARTSSKGSTLIHATGQTVPEENRELFVLQKTEGQWKISRYMFNKMK